MVNSSFSLRKPLGRKETQDVCSTDFMGASCFIPLCIQFSFDFNEIWPEQRQEVQLCPWEQGRCPMCSSSLWQVLSRFPLSVSQSAVLSRAGEHQHSRKILGCAHCSVQHRRDWVRTNDGIFLLSFEGLQWNLHLKKRWAAAQISLEICPSQRLCPPALLQLLPGGKADSAGLARPHYTGWGFVWNYQHQRRMDCKHKKDWYAKIGWLAM